MLLLINFVWRGVNLAFPSNPDRSREDLTPTMSPARTADTRSPASDHQSPSPAVSPVKDSVPSEPSATTSPTLSASPDAGHPSIVPMAISPPPTIIPLAQTIASPEEAVSSETSDRSPASPTDQVVGTNATPASPPSALKGGSLPKWVGICAVFSSVYSCSLTHQNTHHVTGIFYESSK